MSSQLLLDKLDAVRRRQRSVAVAAGACKSVLALLGLIVAFFLLDWLVLSRTTSEGGGDKAARALLVLTILGTFGYVLYRTVIVELRAHPDDDEVALRVERGHPELRGRLISTIQLTRAGASAVSQELIEALEEDTLSFTGGLTFTDIINVQVLKKVAIVAGGLLVLSLALGAWRSDFTKALFGRLLLTEQAYPTAARILSVTPSGRIPHGEPFVIAIELDPKGVLPDHASATIRTATGQSSELPLVRVADAKGADAQSGADKPVVYRGTIEHVLEDLEFRPSAHDALWNKFERIQVQYRPAIKSLSLTCHFPKYLTKPDEVSAVGDIRAPVGSTVHLVAALNKAVKTARLQLRDDRVAGKPLDMVLDAARTTASIDLPISLSGYYRIQLHCVDDFDNASPIDYSIDAIKDRPPVVKITFPAQDKTVTRFARWPIRFTGRDDYGIVRGMLKYRITAVPKDGSADSASTADPDNGPPPQSLPIDGLITAKGQKEVTGEVIFDLRTLSGLQAENRVTYWIEFDDNQEPAPNHGRSSTYTFNVVDVAVMQEMLDRERNALIEGVQGIRDKEKDNRDAVDHIRRDLPQAPATPPGQ
jgi:hypothetical protein